MALGDARDQPVQAEAPEVVSQPPGREGCGGQAEQRGKVRPELGGSESVGQQPEDDERAEEGLDAGIGEAQGREPLIGDHLGALHLLEGCFAEGTVVAESLDVEETSVGLEADLPQGGVMGDPAVSALSR